MTRIQAFITGIFVGAILLIIVLSLQENKNKVSEPAILYHHVYDTIYVNVTIPRDSIVVRYVTRYLEVNKDSNDNRQSNDSVPVKIPITQKQYSDSLYRLWVSGYEPKLDSIHIVQQTKTITKPVLYKAKKNRWGLGVQVGVGATTNKISPYIGVGVSYNILTW